MNDWSKWLDYWLQKLILFVPTHIKDSGALLVQLKPIKIPQNAKLFTVDANLMYNNINTCHAIQVISRWLDELEPNLTDNYPLEAIKFAMKIIMINNLFEWGSLYFLQLLGTTMGASAEVMWDTL